MFSSIYQAVITILSKKKGLTLLLLTFFLFILTSSIQMEKSYSETRKRQELLPFSGRHEVIHHYFNKDRVPGKLTGLHYTKDGLTVKGSHNKAGQAGEFCSEELKMKFPVRDVVLTWNGDVPSLAWLHVQYRVKSDNAHWSLWYDMAFWGIRSPYERNTEDEDYGRLNVDILKADRDIQRIQYCVRFFSDRPNRWPTLTHAAVSYSQPPDDKSKNILMDAPEGARISLPVPWLSQLLKKDVEDDAMILAGLCGPASLTMILNYYGKPVRTKYVGRIAYDPCFDIYGNWAFLAATAGEHRLYAWVQRFSTWGEVRKIVESQTPVIISIAYPQGTFSQEPEKISDGHLLVVRGFTAQGDIICNDPGTAYPEKGDGVVYKWNELGKAFFGHGGVAIVVSRY